MKRLGLAAALLTLVAALGGCATSGSGIGPGEQVHVYVSMPLRGPEAGDGRDVARGARLALDDAHGRVGKLEIRAVYLDDTSGQGQRARWSQAAAAANARRATQDTTSIAYIGDFDSGATRSSLPITNEAHLLQVSPASSAVDLVQPFLGAGDQVPDRVQPTEQRTFGRVIPSDEVQARAGAVWAKRLHSTGVRVIRGGTSYDRVMASAFQEETRAIGLRLTKSGPSDLGYAAIEPRDPLTPLSAIPRVMGTDALFTLPIPKVLYRRHHQLLVTSAAQDPSQLPAAGQRFVREFRDRYGQAPGRYAAYGYEAMSVVLDSIRRAGGNGADRDSVVSEFFDTANRHSVLGTYSIDDVGNTTLNRLAGYRVVDGRPVFDTGLRAPR